MRRAPLMVAVTIRSIGLRRSPAWRATSAALTHYWRIVAYLSDGRTEVFWGHAKSLKEASGKKAAAEDAARQRGWKRYSFETVELTESFG